MPTRITGLIRPRRPLPHLPPARRVGRDEPGPRLLGRLRHPRTPTTRPALEGHGLTFTIGRGNELCVAAVEALAPLVVGLNARSRSPPTWPASGGTSPATASCAGSGRTRASIHLATGGGRQRRCGTCGRKSTGKPLWKLLADMTPEQLVALHRFPLPDRRHHAGRGAGDSPQANEPTKAERERGDAGATAIPAYTTSAGWLGYQDDKLRRLCREAVAGGLHPHQDQGRPRPGRRPPPLRDHPRGDRPRPAS